MLVGPVVIGAVGDAVSITTSFAMISGLYVVAATFALSVGLGWLSASQAQVPIEGD